MFAEIMVGVNGALFAVWVVVFTRALPNLLAEYEGRHRSA